MRVKEFIQQEVARQLAAHIKTGTSQTMNMEELTQWLKATYGRKFIVRGNDNNASVGYNDGLVFVSMSFYEHRSLNYIIADIVYTKRDANENLLDHWKSQMKFKDVKDMGYPRIDKNNAQRRIKREIDSWGI